MIMLCFRSPCRRSAALVAGELRLSSLFLSEVVAVFVFAAAAAAAVTKIFCSSRSDHLTKKRT